MTKDIVFLSARRTAMGTFGGSLKDFSANQLGAFAAKAAIESAGISADAVGHVVFGNALQTSSDAIYTARHVGLNAGVPIETPALTLNRLCGSGFQAIASAAQEIMLANCDVALMRRSRIDDARPRTSCAGARWGECSLGEAGGFFEDLLWAAPHGHAMPAVHGANG
jgi:acetyl-CoA acetyltransferase